MFAFCLPIVLIQGNFDTPGDTSRSDKNRFSRGVQPIFRDICFSCSRAITIHQVIAIFLQFHCLSSHRNDSFRLQLIDQIKLCVRPLSLTHSNTNHKTNSECSGSGLASFIMILVESNIIVLARSCENESVYSWQVKFSNEIMYHRHVTYYIDSVKPKIVIFLLGNS